MHTDRVTVARHRFASLHESGCFVMPNPWDRGSARLLASMGFEALATSSAGLSFALGRPDRPDALALDEVLRNIADVVAASDLPVNADFQAGYGDSPDAVAHSVARCIATGVAGLSIEDASGDASAPLFALDVALERLRAARAAIDESGAQVLLTGRAESFLVGHDAPLDDVLRRLAAYAEAGADCLYAPGVARDEDIAAIVAAVAPKPVNVLARDARRHSVASLARLGVRRISVGSALARVAWGAITRAAREIAEHGTFTQLGEATPFATLDALFATPPPDED